MQPPDSLADQADGDERGQRRKGDDPDFSCKAVRVHWGAKYRFGPQSVRDLLSAKYFGNGVSGNPFQSSDLTWSE
jgi:hypothetical protein